MDAAFPQRAEMGQLEPRPTWFERLTDVVHGVDMIYVVMAILGAMCFGVYAVWSLFAR